MSDPEPTSAGRLPGWSRLVGPVAAAYWLALFVGSHLPLPKGTFGERGGDKLVHFAAYAGLAFLLAAWWSTRGRLSNGRLAAVWVGVCLYGVLDELLQIPVGRECDLLDWLADCIGAAIGVAAFVAVRKLTPIERASPED